MGRVTAIADRGGPGYLRRRAHDHYGGRTDQRHRAPLLPYVLRGDLLTIVTAPVIYSLIVP